MRSAYENSVFNRVYRSGISFGYVLRARRVRVPVFADRNFFGRTCEKFIAFVKSRVVFARVYGGVKYLLLSRRNGTEMVDF